MRAGLRDEPLVMRVQIEGTNAHTAHAQQRTLRPEPSSICVTAMAPMASAMDVQIRIWASAPDLTATSWAAREDTWCTSPVLGERRWWTWAGAESAGCRGTGTHRHAYGDRRAGSAPKANARTGELEEVSDDPADRGEHGDAAVLDLGLPVEWASSWND